MIRYLTEIILFIVLMLCLSISGAASHDSHKSVGESGRYALVISSTDEEKTLRTPRNNATDVAWALHNAGFSVTLLIDGDWGESRDSLPQLSRQLSENANNIGVIYFSGDPDFISFLSPGWEESVKKCVHQNKQNRTDNNSFDCDILFSFLAEGLPKTNRLNLVIADANFKVPHHKRHSTTIEDNSDKSISDNTILFSAAQPGKKHAEGKKRNSPFTAELLKELKTSDRSIIEIIHKVTDQVSKLTKNQQRPWHTIIGLSRLAEEILIPKEVREWANKMNPAINQQVPTII